MKTRSLLCWSFYTFSLWFQPIFFTALNIHDCTNIFECNRSTNGKNTRCSIENYNYHDWKLISMKITCISTLTGRRIYLYHVLNDSFRHDFTRKKRDNRRKMATPSFQHVINFRLNLTHKMIVHIENVAFYKTFRLNRILNITQIQTQVTRTFYIIYLHTHSFGI